MLDNLFKLLFSQNFGYLKLAISYGMKGRKMITNTERLKLIRHVVRALLSTLKTHYVLNHFLYGLKQMILKVFNFIIFISGFSKL
jgi:hypothetical protein